MSLIDDWKSYVEDPGRFKMSHFEGLMSELDTRETLHDAFDRVPGGVAFVEQIMALRAQTDDSGVYLLPSLSDVTDADRQRAVAYRDGMVDRLRELDDEEAAIIAAAPIAEIPVAEYKRLDAARELPVLDAPIRISQDFIFFTSKMPKWIRGLYEAVYMLTTIPEVSRHLLAPIAGYPLDERPAAELWLRGHRMDFCEDRTLLIVGGA